MSHLIWKSYWDNDVDRFRRLLAPAGFNAQSAAKPSRPKPRKGSAYGSGAPGSKGNPSSAAGTIGRSEINSRDYAGLTLLLRAASSTAPDAIYFVEALLDHPAIDIYARDHESGWNALHRALYVGNISIARLLLQAEQRILTETLSGSVNSRVGELIKTKDREGNSPFDLYNSTIATRDATQGSFDDTSDTDSVASGPGEPQFDDGVPGLGHGVHSIPGDELYTFGSNKNFSLGVGDESDRQFPEKLTLNRPEELVELFHRDTFTKSGQGMTGQNREETWAVSLPYAVLTTDAVSNLYVCGVGRGGRLGLGDENTRFRFVPVLGALAGKRVTQIALGQNHTLAVVDNGELWSWGSNSVSQLGYTLPTPAKADEEPVSLTPRQVFGPLKKENVVGIAASPVHSVAHTATSLYCWGRNLGQLGLMDADSRSLEVQTAPRKVAASLISTPILMVSAVEKATTVLLASNTVYVFTSYGYNLIKFPAPDIFANTRLGSAAHFSNANINKIKAITSGGDTIAALSGRGDLFLMNLSHQVDTNMSATSTTNPAKIKKGAVSQAQCIWSARKDGVTSASIGEHGSVIICTESGAVWRRVKRAKAKDASMPGTAGIKRKDFKFQRIPGITNSVAVRSSTFGAFATVRRDCTSVAERIKIEDQTLWENLASLFPLADFEPSAPRGNGDVKFWDKEKAHNRITHIAYDVLRSPDLEADLESCLRFLLMGGGSFDAVVYTSSVPHIKIPVHGWVLSARSPVLRKALAQFSEGGEAEIPEVLSIGRDSDGKTSLAFLGLDIITLLNLVVYVYRDEVIPVWNYLRQVPQMAFRYRQARVELMKLASRLNMAKLEAAARTQSRIVKSLDRDFADASGDVVIDLSGAEVPVHSQLLCQRCPFFYGLFQGRSRGQWLAGRLEQDEDEDNRVRVDLSHMEPRAFRYVVTHLYGDVGLELFDNVACEDGDEFSDLVMEVMSIANELMLDRLSQICQQVISRFVNIRNISLFLNEISPCSVTEFKDAGLEYACLHMEAMLENHLLDDLDDDLMEELDSAVRENQLARAPISRSGRAEMLLHERHPELVEDIDEERRRRTKEMAWRATHREDEKSYLSRDRSRRKTKGPALDTKSPNLRAQPSSGDMMFGMDEEETLLDCPMSPSLRQGERRGPSGTLQHAGSASGLRDKDKVSFRPLSQSQRRQPAEIAASPGPANTPPQLPATPAKETATQDAPQTDKRKKQQQMEASQRAAAELAAQDQPKKAWDPQASETAAVPWKIADTRGPKVSPGNVISATLANRSRIRYRAAPGQALARPGAHGPSTSKAAQKLPIAPYSKSYIKPAPKVEVSLGFSLEDIIGQQQREQELVKEAVAKRPLADIQQEQAFQEWWDQESRRMQEEEARRVGKEKEKTKDKGSKRGGRRGRGGKPKDGSAGGEGSGGPPNAGEVDGGSGRTGAPQRNGRSTGGRGRRGAKAAGQATVS
ncbi:unnamed protein product [Parascedosporium putredinis]|uniref:BTB domain-containing protein n=1 Tax=Parascedosporium putredinis TaxID=1442378 RepID=A0A9P1H4A5_9PEZI|nr:unnamed protein product [Parascedosporium putredinis]CAI7996543.1 unnamed protein product [Parascedosporium putredinis]